MAKKFDVLIIGGGAAGLTAAVFSARAGKSVGLICPDKPGHKLSITGKGRCNLTNNTDNGTIMKNLPKGGRFMFSSLSAFSAADTMALFEELGVPLKTERGRRVFPVSDKAWDVVDALKHELSRLKVTVIAERAVEILTAEGQDSSSLADSRAASVLTASPKARTSSAVSPSERAENAQDTDAFRSSQANGQPYLTEGLSASHSPAECADLGAARSPLCGEQAAACGGASPERQSRLGGAAPDGSFPAGEEKKRKPSVTGVKTNKGEYHAQKVILATGGLSYPATGSTGDGYMMAKALGHSVTKLRGSLVPIETVEECKAASGLTLKNVTLTLTAGNDAKPIFSELGEVSFTAYGVGGPLALSASSYMDEGKNYRLTLDLKPGLDEKKLDLRLQRDFSEKGGSTLEQALRKLLPPQLIPLFLERVSVPCDKRASEISKAQRHELVGAFKSFALTVKRLRPVEEAIITDGGVELKEINPKTMESKLVDGLFFAGEIIDVTGFTGGYNLQVAFSTAYAASQG